MPKKKNKETQTVKQEATPQPPASNDTVVTPSSLLALAAQEPDRQALSEFSDVIDLLREGKNFTFREIADWLCGHGITADHNAVYREYTKGMPKDAAIEERLADQAEEMENRGV